MLDAHLQYYRGSKIASSLADAATYQIDRKMAGDHLQKDDWCSRKQDTLASSLADAGTYQIGRKMAGDHLQEDDWCSLLTYCRGSKIH